VSAGQGWAGKGAFFVRRACGGHHSKCGHAITLATHRTARVDPSRTFRIASTMFSGGGRMCRNAEGQRCRRQHRRRLQRRPAPAAAVHARRDDGCAEVSGGKIAFQSVLISTTGQFIVSASSSALSSLPEAFKPRDSDRRESGGFGRCRLPRAANAKPFKRSDDATSPPQFEEKPAWRADQAMRC